MGSVRVRDLVTVLPCDAAAQAVHQLCRAEGIPLLGGGGTDMRTGFAAALRTTPRPDVVVILTDGQTAWPRTQPACRTVVGLFPRRRQSYERRPPDWARVVTLSS